MSMIGKTLGTFECTALLGKGGMGEVYRAKDQKLGRDVAIKVLPEEFAQDTDRVARFQREAKLLASLNHPNIAAIYGLEESDGTHFLVLELIEGDTLADRIKGGPIPVEESLKLALQITEALEAAHEKGVIHRDLKPANIKVTPDGKVKVLDFGLAKAFAGEQPEVNLSQSPTLSAAATQQGVILGTAAYMSPEQARGNPVDKRSDIWAFGVVLFEMLTGRSIFSEDTVSDTLASVLKSEPDWQSLPPDLHPRIRLLFERCLEKDPRDRYGSIGDARVDIQKVLADRDGIFSPTGREAKPKGRLRTIFPWAASFLIIGAMLASITIWNLRTPVQPQPIHFTDDLPYGLQFGDLSRDAVLAVSPDGSKIVYSTIDGLYLRSLGGLNPKLIPGTRENVAAPFFSPDGEWIGYWSNTDNRLKKIPINGGDPQPLADDPHVGIFDWTTDGTILYAVDNRIMKISDKGGTPETIIETESEPVFNPQLLPDGKSVLFTIDAEEGYKVALQSLESGNRKTLIDGGSARFCPTGHLLYTEGNDLYAAPFNSETLEVTGQGIPIVEGTYLIGVPQFAVSSSGTFAYLPETISPLGDLVWVDHDGKEEKINTPLRRYNGLRISPDATRIAVSVLDTGNEKIEIWDLNRDNFVPLTSDSRTEGNPLWTLDNREIVFSRSSGAASFGIYRKASDGTGEIEKIYANQGQQMYPESWSKDGKELIGRIQQAGLVPDIGMLSMEGDSGWQLLLDADYAEYMARISPDGRWIAYQANEIGRNEVYVRPYPNVNERKWAVSTGGGSNPLWAPDSRQLFYRNGDAVMKVMLDTELEFKPKKPVELFKSPGLLEQWDIHPNGKQFLMIKAAGTSDQNDGSRTSRKINIVLNWFEELKERVPTD